MCRPSVFVHAIKLSIIWKVMNLAVCCKCLRQNYILGWSVINAWREPSLTHCFCASFGATGGREITHFTFKRQEKAHFISFSSKQQSSLIKKCQIFPDSRTLIKSTNDRNRSNMCCSCLSACFRFLKKFNIQPLYVILFV